MAKTVINAEVRVSGPKGLAGVARQIQRGLTGISANVGVKINQAAAKNVAALDSNLKILNATLKTTSVMGSSAAVGISQVGAAARKSATAIGSVGKAANTASAGVGKAAKNTEKLSNEMAEFGRVSGLAIRRFAGFSIATGVIFGLIRAVSNATSEAITFEREMIRVAQVTGGTVASLRDLQKEVTSLATGLGVSSTDLLKVSRILAQTGLTAKETAQALEALAKSELAPTFTNIEQTAEGAIAIMRQFGIEASGLEKALGSVNAVAGKFAVESDDIIQAVRRAGGVFAAASHGVSEGTDALNEFIAVFTSVRATTRESAESIATGLRTIFTRLQRNTTIESLEELGIRMRDLEGKFVGPYKAINNIAIALEKIDPRDRRFAAIAEELGGFRQISKVIPLVQQLETRLGALGVAQEGQSSLSRDAEKAQESLAVQFQKTRENFSALIREVTASDTFKAFAKTALALADGFIALARTVKPLIPILTAFAAIKLGSSVAQFLGGFGTGARGGGAGGFGVGAANLLSGARFNTGGLVPGRGPNRDTVPASLTKGEFVIQRPAVDNLGVPFLERLNRNKGGSVPGFNDGDFFDDEGKASIPPGQFPQASGIGRVDVSNKKLENAVDVGGLFLRPFGVDKVVSGSIPINSFAPQSTITKGPNKGKSTGLSFSPGNKTERIAVKNKYGLAQNATKIPFNIHIGSLPQSSADDFEGNLEGITANFIKEQAKSVFGGKGLPKTSEIRKNLEKFNFPQISGNLFEAMISSSSGKFDDKTTSNANLDFDSITSRVATAFNNPALAGLPGDAKRTLGTEAVASLIKKTKNYISQTVKPEKKGLNEGGPGEVNAMLTKGEFVLQKKAVDRIGVANARKLNDSTDTPKFHTGGLVGLNKGGGLPGYNNAGPVNKLGEEETYTDLFELGEKAILKGGKAVESGFTSLFGLLVGKVEGAKKSIADKKVAKAEAADKLADKRGRAGLKSFIANRPGGTPHDRFKNAKSLIGKELTDKGVGAKDLPKAMAEVVREIRKNGGNVPEAISTVAKNVNKVNNNLSKAADNSKAVANKTGQAATTAAKQSKGGGFFANRRAENELFRRAKAGEELGEKDTKKLEAASQRRFQQKALIGLASTAIIGAVSSQAEVARKKAVESGDARGAGVASAISGAVGGAGAGFAVAGPLGAVVGGVAGAASAFISAQQSAAEEIAQNKLKKSLDGLAKEVEIFKKDGTLKGLNEAIKKAGSAASEAGDSIRSRATGTFGGLVGSALVPSLGGGNEGAKAGAILGPLGLIANRLELVVNGFTGSDSAGEDVRAAAAKFDKNVAEETFRGAKSAAIESKNAIAALIERGKTNKEIATLLPDTVQALALGTDSDTVAAINKAVEGRVKERNAELQANTRPRYNRDTSRQVAATVGKDEEARIRREEETKAGLAARAKLLDAERKSKEVRDNLAIASRLANKEVDALTDRLLDFGAASKAATDDLNLSVKGVLEDISNFDADVVSGGGPRKRNIFKNIRGTDKETAIRETDILTGRLRSEGNNQVADDIDVGVKSFKEAQAVLPGLLQKFASERANKLDEEGKDVGLAFVSELTEALGDDVPNALSNQIVTTINNALSASGGGDSRQTAGQTVQGLIESGSVTSKLFEVLKNVINTAATETDQFNNKIVKYNSLAAKRTSLQISQNRAEDATLKIRQSNQGILDGINEVRGGEGVRSRFRSRVSSLTTRGGLSGTLDASAIATRIASDRSKRQGLIDQQRKLRDRGEDGDLAAVNALQSEIDALSTSLVDNKAALTLLSTSTDELTAIQKDIADLERRKQLGEKDFEQLATGGPQEIIELTRRIQAGFSFLSGNVTAKGGIAGVKTIENIFRGSNDDKSADFVTKQKDDLIIKSLRDRKILPKSVISGREEVIGGKDKLKADAEEAARKRLAAARKAEELARASNTLAITELTKAMDRVAAAVGAPKLGAKNGAIVPGAGLGAGGGMGDRVPAMLEPGELVVPNRSAGATVAAMQAAGIPVPGFRNGTRRVTRYKPQGFAAKKEETKELKKRIEILTRNARYRARNQPLGPGGSRMTKEQEQQLADAIARLRRKTPTPDLERRAEASRKVAREKTNRGRPGFGHGRGIRQAAAQILDSEQHQNVRKRAANRSLNAQRRFGLSRVRQRAMEITARTGGRGGYEQARNEIRAEVAAEKARKRQAYLNRRGMQSGGRAPGGTPVSRGGGAGNFAQVADAMKGAAESLNKLVSGLGEINIPERIEMSATIEHNVNINGAEVLSQMKEGLAAVARDVVITELSKHMDLTTGETNESSGSGSTGGQTPIAGKAV